ncbi:MAG: acyl-CoA dehydrogenase family protein, partial [Candidatus Bathyarchaeia archaeon]
MDFDLTDEERLIRKQVSEFASTEIAPIAAVIDKEKSFPWEAVKKTAELNLMGVYIPEEYGGAGLSTVSYAITVEELSKVSASIGVIVSVNNSLVCDPLYRWGTDPQKRKYLIPLAKGEKLGAYALTEPNAGSDAAAILTTAQRTSGGYLLNGSKMWVTNGNEAQVFIVYARTGPLEERHRNIDAFIVERDFQGFHVTSTIDKLGIRGSSSTEILLKDCFVPEENLLGEVNGGFKVAMTTLDAGRIGIGAQAVGIAQASLDASIAYAKSRVAFGQPIAEFQAIQWMIADMAVETEAARV